MEETDKSDTKRKMLNALEESLSIVTLAAQKAGIHRSTHYQWMQDDLEYKKQVEELNNVCLDFAESKLFDNMRKNKETSTIFFLKTRGKNRGYVERQEIDLGTDNHFRVEIVDPLDEDTKE